jgi:hypothetical protein
MNILTSDDRDFNSKMDSLVSTSMAHPIYNSAHCNYYKSTQNLIYLKNYSVVIIDESGTPIVGLIALSFRDPTSNKIFLSYFSNPAAILISCKQPSSQVDNAVSMLNTFLVSKGFLQVLSTSQFNIRVYGYRLSCQISEILELLLKIAMSVDIEFERSIDLTLTHEQLHKDLSKSVLIAMKKSKEIKVETRIACWNDSKGLISESVSNLRALHLASAGRVTRTSESWAIQEQQIVDGSMVIVNGVFNDKIVHGSLFLISNAFAYYGVGANLLESKNSVSHVFFLDTMFFLKEIGIKNLYIGQQYENLRGVTDTKLLNISKFKSFFGGFLIPNLIIKNET